MKIVTVQDAWAGEADCRNCALRNTALFAGLDETDFEKIHKPIDQFIIPTGSVLYQTNDSAEYLYTIRSGVIKLTQYLSDGSQRIVRLGFSSDVIGLESILLPNYQHNAVALRDSEVCRIPVTIVNTISTDNQALHQELLKRWQSALNEADTWLTQLSTGSAKQRMARLILKLADKYGPEQCELFSREDIGSMLGITTETASRTIAEFKRNALINQVDNHIYSIRSDQLELVSAD